MQNEPTVREAIESRRSIRKYTDEPLSDEVVRELVRQAGLAPSSMNVQPWRVVAVRTPELKRSLRKAAMNQAQVEAAPVVFVVLTDEADTLETLREIVHPGYGEGAEARAEAMGKSLASQDPEARAAAMANYSFLFVAFLALAAQGMGYASSVMTGFEEDKVRQVLDLPAHQKVSALVAVGRPAEEGFSHHRHPVDRILSLR